MRLKDALCTAGFAPRIGVDKQKSSRYSLSFGDITLLGSEHAEAWL